MIDKSFLEKIEEMARLEIHSSNGREYSTKSLHSIKPPLPNCLEVHTLTGLVDYLRANKDNLKTESLIVVVAGPKTVQVGSRLCEKYKSREFYIQGKAFSSNFNFGSYLPQEDFVISLLSLFVQTETVEKILKIVSNITETLSANHQDDGVSQNVTVKSGVARVEKMRLPNPVKLAPYRTFLEVEQPESEFVLRIKSRDGKQPLCALFEADGGQWKLEAIQRVKAWLTGRVPGGVTVIA